MNEENREVFGTFCEQSEQQIKRYREIMNKISQGFRKELIRAENDSRNKIEKQHSEIYLYLDGKRICKLKKGLNKQ